MLEGSDGTATLLEDFTERVYRNSVVRQEVVMSTLTETQKPDGVVGGGSEHVNRNSKTGWCSRGWL